jgi:FKBP-type peptidyl-prolyl cis-trans isomerase
MPSRLVPFLLIALVAACGDSAPVPTAKPGLPAPPDVAAPPPNSLKAPSGLSTRVLQAGTGQRHPRASDTVVVHYTGWTTDGQMFDSSVQRGEPTEFQVSGVIRGWTEGLQMMVEGEKRRLWVPQALAYQGQPGQPQGMLVFDVELIDIK